MQRGTLLWPCPSEAGGAPLSCPGNSSSTKAGPGVGEGGDPGPKNKGQKKKIIGLGQLDIHMNLDPYLIQKNTSRRIMAYLSRVRLSATPWTVAHQAPLSMDSPGKNTRVEQEIKSPSSAGKKKQESSRKNIYFCFIDYTKAFDCVDHNKLWKILKEMGIPDHLTCLLRNLYAGQEATVRTGHGTTDWFQTGKGVQQGCTLSPCLFN